MRIPKINKRSIGESEATIITHNIDVELLERVYYEEDIDPDNPKTFPKVLRDIKGIARASHEYRGMAEFLKEYHDMNQSFFFKGVKKTHDKKFSIELHHTPFVMEDIVTAVIKKRMANGESLVYQKIAEEIMLLHYTGKVGLVPLDKTSHALIHSENAPEVFIPLQFIEFGDYHEFYKEYKEYIPDNTKANYAYLQELSMKYENLEDVIPKYMKPKHLYYEGFIKLEKFKEVLDKIEVA